MEIKTAEQTLVCRTCGKSKPLSEYYKKGKGREGYISECKPCKSERNKTYWRNNSYKKEKEKEIKVGAFHWPAPGRARA